MDFQRVRNLLRNRSYATRFAFKSLDRTYLVPKGFTTNLNYWQKKSSIKKKISFPDKVSLLWNKVQILHRKVQAVKGLDTKLK